MRKLDHLRQHLLARVPGLARDPDRLLTFVQDGRIQFHRGQHLSHEYTVPAQIILLDYSGELDAVILPLLQWLSRYEPASAGDEAVQFEAEILSNHNWDLALSVRLTERVVATVDCDSGQIHVDHRLPAYEIEPCPARDWQLYMRRTEVEEDYTLIAEWSESDD